LSCTIPANTMAAAYLPRLSSTGVEIDGERHAGRVVGSRIAIDALGPGHHTVRTM
jgi:hypothetical protein